MEQIQSKQIEEYIKSTLDSIKQGVHADGISKIDGSIVFDIAVTNLKEGEGNIKVYVVGLEGKSRSEVITRIYFKVKPYTTAPAKQYIPSYKNPISYL
jgi:hypothetical protein